MRQVYYKIRQLLQIATTLLQNTTVITNCDSTNLNVIFKANLIFPFSFMFNFVNILGVRNTKALTPNLLKYFTALLHEKTYLKD